MNQASLQSTNKLVTIYNDMMHSVREAYDDTDMSDLSLQNALEEAKEKAVDVGIATLDEAHEISEYIKRDINDAAEYLMETSADFSDWLLLDIDIVERKIIDLFLSVADKTRVELNQLKQAARERPVYSSGEITAPGTIQCSECGELVSLYTTSEINPCPKCNNKQFLRADKKTDNS